MSLSTKEAIEANQILGTLSQAEKDSKFVFRGATRLKLSANRRKLAAVADEFLKEKNELIKRLGTPSVDNADNIEIKKDSPNFPIFQKEFDEMVASDSEVSLTPISSEELFNSRIVKSRDGEGKVYENHEENQIEIDLLAVLQNVGLVVDAEPVELEIVK